MSRLFISLYLDEDVSVLIAELLRRRGFAVTTTQEEGRLGRDDPDQLAFASQRRLAIVTHNRDDFETLARHYIATGRMHSGIIAAVRRPPHDIASRLLVLLNQRTADEMDNQLLYI